MVVLVGGSVVILASTRAKMAKTRCLDWVARGLLNGHLVQVAVLSVGFGQKTVILMALVTVAMLLLLRDREP
jgi:hypothetical protein